MINERRVLAIVLMVIMVGDIAAPTVAFALTSGPSQPEVQGFTPASANDMVDLFSGNLSYNIPLFDVEGYPVNLFYNAGVGMDQEASWVGLGWNLNPGVVERNMRGLPDDFNGEIFKREIKQKNNWSLGVGAKVTFEMFGFTPIPEGGNTGGGTLSLSLSPTFNSYEGVSVESGISMGLRSSQGNKCQFNGELGLTSHSNRGLRLQPRVGFGRRLGSSDLIAGLNFGLSLDSRMGLTNISFGADLTRTELKHYCDPVNSSGDRSSITEATRGMGSSFDVGAPSYTPEIAVPMKSTSMTFNVTTGLSAFGGHPNFRWRAFYSTMSVREREVQRKAFGYMHLGDAGITRNAMLDFNREKDGPYSPDKAALGIAQLTNDVFTASGQGVAGSYRAFRADVGNVHDPYNASVSDGFTLGIELGAGNLSHQGSDVMVNNSKSHSGKWTEGNQIAWALPFQQETSNPSTEIVYFREASEHTLERDPDLWNAMDGATPKGFNMALSGGQNASLQAKLTSDWFSSSTTPALNYRRKREARAQLFTYLTHEEALVYGVKPPSAAPIVSSLGSSEQVVQPHHMSEITILGEGGQRYVYGQPVYNLFQQDVEFSTTAADDGTGLVPYNLEDASVDNTQGREHYFSRSTTPGYPYAFLLTSLLSKDYSDVDPTPGPSEGDLGTYTLFEYSTGTDNFKWRAPASAPVTGANGRARLSRGRLADNQDNKGIYSYGEKQVKYLQAIRSRNMEAEFFTSNRNDALPVNEQGFAETDGHKAQQLDRIAIYTIGHALDGTELRTLVKTVHFDYDYSLCYNTPNSNDQNKGKLTLKKVWFTYGESSRGRTSPYTFDYGGSGPTYDANAQDRWGCYKPNDALLANQDYPYSVQDAPEANSNAAAWNLKTIITPSGGKITVEYEADDYAFVQNKKAMRMFALDAAASQGSFVPPSTYGDPTLQYKVYLALPLNTTQEQIEALFAGVTEVYFRVMVKMSDEGEAPYDFVSGYCGLNGPPMFDEDLQKWYFNLAPVQIDEEAGYNVAPPYRAALEYAQLNYPKYAHTGAFPAPDGDDETSLLAFFPMLASSILGLVSGLGGFFTGPNAEMKAAGKCGEFDYDQCWFRLNAPKGVKKGGGHRVAKVLFSDQWEQMEPVEDDETYTYGKSYIYGDASGSYGVAAYEPMVGADENALRRPIYGFSSRTLSPDERFYQEEPFGEYMYPSASVGYSKVIVKDLYRNGDSELQASDPIVRQQGTGSVVHEFYTAKDFPTRSTYTKLQMLPRRNKLNLLALVGFKHFDHMHASQGFTVETNDMHGKPKMTSVYRQGSDQAISSIRYEYQTTLANGQGPLSNTATTIDSDGIIGQAEIGRLYEFVADTREFQTKNTAGGIQNNLDSFLAAILPAAWAGLWPKFSSESTRFKTGVLVKKVTRAGILKKVVKMDNGSTVTTEHLAYDAHTGAVLLTRTKNDFEDPVHTMKFPAYWRYDGMGPAYKNIGNVMSSITFDQQGRATVGYAPAWFSAGDELALDPANGGAPVRGWIDEVRPDGVTVINRTGLPIVGVYGLKVIRSGRRNMHGQDMMSVISYSDPLAGMAGNIYASVVDVAAVEFSDSWLAPCNCFPETPHFSNRWVTNKLGTWRLAKEHKWLTDRTRSVENRNANIKRDGWYTAFSPFYQLTNGVWSTEYAGWTTVRAITSYNSRGAELENRDALGLFSAATFGHGGTLPLSVSKNTRYRETIFTSFEDRAADGCEDNRFTRPTTPDITPVVVEGIAHTGRRSVKVEPGERAQMGNSAWLCDCQLTMAVINATASRPGFVFVTNGSPPITFTWSYDSWITENGTCNLMPLSPTDSPWTNFSTILSPYVGMPGAWFGSDCQYNGFPMGVKVIAEDANGCRGIVSINAS